ncbi:unnamed protein product, partial [Polarella glacialis]
NGSVDLDEFVETQGLAEIAAGSRCKSPKKVLVVQYLEARAIPGHRPEGGLDFPGFADWQMRWQADRWAGSSDLQDCYQLLGSENRLWKAGEAMAAEADRKRREVPKAWKYRAGGGMSTVRKGFVEDKRQTLRNMRMFETAQAEFLKEESSDEEGWLAANAETARKISEEGEEKRRIAAVDSTSARLARELSENRRDLAVALMPSELERCRAREETVRAELSQLLAELPLERAGSNNNNQLLLRGSVAANGRCASAVVQLLNKNNSKNNNKNNNHNNNNNNRESRAVASTETGADGSFRLCVPFSVGGGGRALTLLCRERGFADNYQRCSGPGLHRPNLELMPLSIRSVVEAKPGSTEIALCRDSVTGARISIPLGKILKNGVPFYGKANFAAAIVLPEKNLTRSVASRSRAPRSNGNVAQGGGGASQLPDTMGRTIGGLQVPVVLVAAVFTQLTDEIDGKELALQPGAGLHVATPLALASRQCHQRSRSPSVWKFDASEGGWWRQMLTPVAVSERELPRPPEPEVEAKQALAVSFAWSKSPCGSLRGLASNRDAKVVAEMRGGQQALKRATREAPAQCMCGFEARREIMPRLRSQHRTLRLANPPKRVFARVEEGQDEGEGLRLAFLYGNSFDLSASIERAVADPEVVLSHHMWAAQRLLDPSPEIAKDLGLSSASAVGSQEHYSKVGKKVLPHLQHIASYLVAGAKAVNPASGSEMKDIHPMAFQLTVLEALVNLWIRPRPAASPPTTQRGLHEALLALGGDVAHGLLAAASEQAHRDELAHIRAILRRKGHSFTAIYVQVKTAMRAATSSGPSRSVAGDAAAALARDASVLLAAEALHLRHLVSQIIPDGKRATVEVVQNHLKQRTSRMFEAQRAVQDNSAQIQAADNQVEKSLRIRSAAELAALQAAQRGDPPAELAALKTARSAAEQAKTSQDEAQRLRQKAPLLAKEAEDEQSFAGPARRLAEELQDPRIKAFDERDDADAAWQKVSTFRGPDKEDTLSLTFVVHEPGTWECVASPEAVLMPPPADKDRNGSDNEEEGGQDIDNAWQNVEVEEFFPPIPPPQCPVLRVSTMVLGAFSGAATEVICQTFGTCGASRAQVIADGTFCLFTAASMPFELWVKPVGPSTEPLRFGPFLSRSGDEVTHVTLLEPRFASEPGYWTSPAMPPALQILLPRLEPFQPLKEAGGEENNNHQQQQQKQQQQQQYQQQPQHKHQHQQH